MYKSICSRVLPLLKVPPEPHAPIGDPASLRIFNAGWNYFRLRLVGWAFTQALALAGFIFWTAVLLEVEKGAAAQKEGRNQFTASVSAVANGENLPVAEKKRRAAWQAQASRRIGRAFVQEEPGQRKHKSVHPWNGFTQSGVELAVLLPSGAFVVIWALKILSFLIYLAQIPITYAIRRLDFEMRWYMVTDRSLRLRSGVWRVSEATMSFANIQQVRVSQGPVQRWLGLADVKVTSAGGGSGGHYEHDGNEMHTGLFHCVTNADEIRDLILERLRRFRETGLGDPDEKRASAGASSSGSSSPGVLGAARELAEEARALRMAVGSR